MSSSIINRIRNAWKEKKFVLIYDADDREGEVDMVMPTQLIESEHIPILRKDAGGLICSALSHEFCEEINLPFIADIYQTYGQSNTLIANMVYHKLPYGAKSSFSVTVNHANAFTGITDIDRAMTINEMGQLSLKFESSELKGEKLIQEFSNSFRLPGHVPILRAADGLLNSRQGHTELSLVLCKLTGFAQSAVMCEMMDGKTRKALPVDEAQQYAELHDLPFISGQEIRALWKQEN